MKAAWEWVKKYWELLVGALLLFLGVFLGFWMKKRPSPVVDNPEKKEIEEKADEEIKKLQEKAEEDKKELREQHEEDIKNVLDEQQAAEPALEKDQDATNKYLLDVGRQVRGDSDDGGSK